MGYFMALRSRILVFIPLTLMILLMACGGDATATPKPADTPVPGVQATAVPDATDAPVPPTPRPTITTAEDIATPVAAPTSTKKPPAAVMEKLSGTLDILLIDFERETLDMGFSSTSAKKTVGHMFNYLIGVLPGAVLTPDRGLATKWETGPGAKSVRFDLRKGVKWHDGQEFTADDVVFTMERYSAEETTCVFCGQMKELVTEVEVIDPYTVDIKLLRPDITFFSTLSSRDTDIVMIPRRNFTANADGTFELLGDPIGTGQVKFKERTLGDFITYEAFEDYWDTNFPPTWAERRVIASTEPAVRLAALRTGEVDMTQIDSDQVPQVEELACCRNAGQKAVGTFIIAFPQSWDPDFITNKVEFRKALALAIDMEEVAKALYTEGTYALAATAFWGLPAVVGYDPDLVPYPYDPDQARELLKQSGYNGEKLPMWVISGASWCAGCEELMELAQGYWLQVGVETETRPSDWPSYASLLRSDDGFSKSAVGHIGMDKAPGRPMALQNMLISWVSLENGGNIHSFYDLDLVDTAYKAGAAATTVAELGEIIREFNRESYANYPAIPVVSIDETWALGPDIESWAPGDMGFGYHFETVIQKK